MPGPVPHPTQVIHMTHASNLPAIVGAELRPVAMLNKGGFTNIAYNSIQEQRATKAVPCGPGGSLHDYVPFYFTRKSPMLYTINRGNVPCDGGQDRIIHLVTTAQHIAERGYGFAFSDGHGIMSYTEFFDDLGDLDKVDWNTINATYWHDTSEDGDRKRRKQAEFLVHGPVAWTDLSDIVVRTQTLREEVAQAISHVKHKPNLIVQPNWYY
jgi:hypothetical protein